MFLFDWFYGILISLGLRQKEAKVLLHGPDIANKRQLLRTLGEPYSTSAEFSIGKIKFKVFDLGGHQIARRVWNDYNAKVDAVVYMVDAFDLGRHAESKDKLDALLSNESLANVPFLIFAYVFMYTCSEESLLSRLGLTNSTTGKGMVNLGDTNVRPLEVFKYATRQGCIDGFKWLSQYIK